MSTTMNPPAVNGTGRRRNNGGHGTANNPAGGLTPAHAESRFPVESTVKGFDGLDAHLDTKTGAVAPAFSDKMSRWKTYWGEIQVSIETCETVLARVGRYDGNLKESFLRAVAESTLKAAGKNGQKELDFSGPNVQAVWASLGERASYAESCFLAFMEIQTPRKGAVERVNERIGECLRVLEDSCPEQEIGESLRGYKLGANALAAEIIAGMPVQKIRRAAIAHLARLNGLYLDVMLDVQEIQQAARKWKSALEANEKNPAAVAKVADAPADMEPLHHNGSLDSDEPEESEESAE